MTVKIAEQFTVAYASAASADVAGPEMLPVRLARACVEVLPVAGVGISMFGAAGMRVPIGASDDDAAAAERLQFTAAEGPCLEAHELNRSVLATESFLAQRWPDFYSGLVTRTPFRAIVALPWPHILNGSGTIDLLFRRSLDLAEFDFADADAVVARVECILDAESMVEESPLGAAPAWLNGPAANSRNVVFIAMGMLNVALDVSTSDALALLRGHAYATGRTVDDVAHDLANHLISASELRVSSNQ
jgi:hypothetical protein